MAANAACTHEGSTARLWCVTCEEPICTRCMVETRVGFKCQEHGRMGAVAAPAKATAGGADPAKAPGKGRRRDRGKDQTAGDGPPAPPPGRPPRRGFGFIGFIIVAFLVFPVLTVGLGFLFAATGNQTGFMAFLPLLAVFVVLIGGTAVVARRILR